VEYFPLGPSLFILQQSDNNQCFLSLGLRLFTSDLDLRSSSSSATAATVGTALSLKGNASDRVLLMETQPQPTKM